jgi:hypothetical protein
MWISTTMVRYIRENRTSGSVIKDYNIFKQRNFTEFFVKRKGKLRTTHIKLDSRSPTAADTQKRSAKGFRLLRHKELRHEFSRGMDRTPNIPALSSRVDTGILLVLSLVKEVL